MKVVRRGAGHLRAAALKGISVPALCLLGEEGAHDWYRRCASYVAENLPHGQLRVIGGASHAAFRDNPEAFAAAVAEACLGDNRA